MQPPEQSEKTLNPLTSSTTNCLGRPRSAVWDYSLYVKSTNKSVCQIESCQIQVSGKFTTNLKRHLEEKHNEEFLKVERAEQQNRSEKEKRRNSNISSKVKNDNRQRTPNDLMKKKYQRDRSIKH